MFKIGTKKLGLCANLLILLGALFIFSAAFAETLPPPHQHHKKTKSAQKKCHYTKHYDKHHRHYHYIRICPKKKLSWNERFNNFIDTLTPAQRSALEQRLTAQKEITKTRQGVSFYEPTYALPFYYTGRPYQSVYQGNTPDNEPINNEEFKGQLSFQFPVWANMFGSKASLDVSYTQLSYWQVYNKSAFFRETNYEPQIFFSDNFAQNWLGSIGLNHQSNGRGVPLERSWNRLFLDIAFSGSHWLIDLKPWIPVFTGSSNMDNPDITNFLGYGRLVIAVKFYNQEISLMTRNAVESGFKRGALQLDYNFPIHGILHGDIQFFSGYGQSLIEYNHYTNSFGLGFSISGWL
jgi:phospholipase A1